MTLSTKDIPFLSLTDPVTRLPNQESFIARLQDALTGDFGPQETGAVLLVDLDSFRKIKGNYGYLVGNELL